MIAILSVSDKTGIGDFAGGLLELGWEIAASDGTHRAIGRDVGRISDLARIPALLGGRVKALTVSVMAGILARDTPADLAELQAADIRRIHLVCCNFGALPDRATSLADFQDAVDIGGPAMLRAAAKNCAHVIPLTDPADYPDVIAALNRGEVPVESRTALAAKAFRVSSDYDARVGALFESVC
ncbi:phosphoribosylaminoimidazolecarboxamide formyltransferase [Actinosynnema sp. ALI-1.44]|uniref:phosphoribosylaminoimidazolecarboxamide formyltransferase n=1 Tax=Actinosynnema sp. ALI-1.44 TaxID=1933779 RepID=UPI00097C6EEA|nr:phosphoribosylaminoimidazolecarboxamide formyltransferase [Actinosynnema sp. ALI-1.44]ONI77979.1 phosphoribosylaminoimidazolecarboxamide formyltransferase [Actinosynnema sp. ALI-1.44]